MLMKHIQMLFFVLACLLCGLELSAAESPRKTEGLSVWEAGLAMENCHKVARVGWHWLLQGSYVYIDKQQGMLIRYPYRSVHGVNRPDSAFRISGAGVLVRDWYILPGSRPCP